MAALAEMYVQGVSTRKVKAITEELCGHSFSASAISAINQRLDASLGTNGSNPASSSAESVSASEFQGCRQTAPRFRGALRVHGDLRRDVPGATRHHFAFFSDRH